MRTARMMLAHDYCEELTGAICLDTLRLELLHETNEMRKRAFLLPKNAMVHQLPRRKNGEHGYALYDVKDHGQNVIFYSQEDKKIQNFWAVPSFEEIFAIDQQIEQFNALNFKHLYQFNFGDHKKMNWYNMPTLSEFSEKSQKSLIAQHIPKISYCDLMQSEAQFQSNLRLVDFKQSYRL